MPRTRFEETKQFVMEAVKADEPALWFDVHNKGKKKGLTKTYLYQAREVLREDGSLVFEDGILRMPDEATKGAWAVLAQIMVPRTELLAWHLVRTSRVDPKVRIAYAEAFGRAVSDVVPLPCSPGLIRRLNRDLSTLTPDVFAALLPLLQHLLRSAYSGIASAQGPPVGPTWTKERVRELEEAIATPLRRTLRRSPKDIDELTLCANLLFELLSRERLDPSDVRLAMDWALRTLRGAESVDEYLSRWEALEALVREGRSDGATSRRLEISALRGSDLSEAGKPWLSELPDRLLRIRPVPKPASTRMAPPR